MRFSCPAGVSTIAGSFNEEVLQEMAAINHRPIVFPLSNPTTKSECTFEDAFKCVSRAPCVCARVRMCVCEFGFGCLLGPVWLSLVAPVLLQHGVVFDCSLGPG